MQNSMDYGSKRVSAWRACLGGMNLVPNPATLIEAFKKAEEEQREIVERERKDLEEYNLETKDTRAELKLEFDNA